MKKILLNEKVEELIGELNKKNLSLESDESELVEEALAGFFEHVGDEVSKELGALKEASAEEIKTMIQILPGYSISAELKEDAVEATINETEGTVKEGLLKGALQYISDVKGIDMTYPDADDDGQVSTEMFGETSQTTIQTIVETTLNYLKGNLEEDTEVSINSLIKVSKDKVELDAEIKKRMKPVA